MMLRRSATKDWVKVNFDDAWLNVHRQKLMEASNDPNTFWKVLKQKLFNVPCITNSDSEIIASQWQSYFKDLLFDETQPKLANLN